MVNEDHYSFLAKSCCILLIMRNVSDKRCRENQNTRFVFNTLFFLNLSFMRDRHRGWRVIKSISWRQEFLRCGLGLTPPGYGPLAHYCAHSNYPAAAAHGTLFIDYKRLRTNCSKNWVMCITVFTSYMPVVLLTFNVFASGHVCNRKTMSTILRT
jgi:hypothetical protein